jgi:hypothetical protein
VGKDFFERIMAAALSAHEVGSEFVRRYYHYWNNQPDKLYCFYDTLSTFSSSSFAAAGRPVLNNTHIVLIDIGLGN